MAIYSWSCEDNPFVERADTEPTIGRPVLNVISASDPCFSPANPWLGNAAAKGHCADALKANKDALIVLIEQAPHALLNVPQARSVTEAVLRNVVSR